MAKYLLSTHGVEGKAREPMGAEEMRAMMARIGDLEREMEAAGAWVVSGRLHGPEATRIVDRTGDQPVITDGPFAETKEHLAGFYVIEAGELDGALAWAGKVSATVGAPIEVRPFAGFTDRAASMGG